MSAGRPIGEEDLHRYVDDRLDPERRARVDAYLSEHPEAARRLRGWQEDAAALRGALAWRAQEPVPAALSIPRLAQARLARRWAPGALAASVAAALVLGAAGGWLAHGPDAASSVVAVGMEAAAAHRVFAVASAEPAESGYGPEDRAELARWTTRAFGHKLTPPDLSAAGWMLLGGRRLASASGAGCVFFYANASGRRITLLVRPVREGGQMPMRAVQTAGAAGYAWARDGLGFSLISSEPSDPLHALSDKIRSDLGAHM